MSAFLLNSLDDIRDIMAGDREMEGMLTKFSRFSGSREVSIGDIALASGNSHIAIFVHIVLLDWMDIRVKQSLVGQWALPALQRASHFTTERRVLDAIETLDRWHLGAEDADLVKAEDDAFDVMSSEVFSRTGDPSSAQPISSAAWEIAAAAALTLTAITGNPDRAAGALTTAMTHITNAGLMAFCADLLANRDTVVRGEKSLEYIDDEPTSDTVRRMDAVLFDSPWADYQKQETGRQHADLMLAFPPRVLQHPAG